VAARLGVRTAPGLNMRNWCWPKLARAPTRPPLVDEKQWAGIEAADSCLGEISRSEVEEISRMDWRRGKEGHGLYPRLSPSSTDSGLVEREDFAGVRAGSVAAITEKRLKRALSVWTHRVVTHPKRAGEVRV
jgi:hypothetical protein